MYRHISDCPGSVDFVICGIDKTQVPQLIIDSAAKGAKAMNLQHTFNLSWEEMDSLTGDDEPTMWKLSYEAATLLFKDTRLSDDGVAASVSIAAELFDDVPAENHDEIVKANARITSR